MKYSSYQLRLLDQAFSKLAITITGAELASDQPVVPVAPMVTASPAVFAPETMDKFIPTSVAVEEEEPLGLIERAAARIAAKKKQAEDDALVDARSMPGVNTERLVAQVTADLTTLSVTDTQHLPKEA